MKLRTYEILRRAGLVRRLHTVPTLGGHTLNRHVYGAQILALALLERCPRANRGAVLETLLLHDAPEVYTGDIPAPVKRAHPLILAALDNMERNWYSSYDIKLPELTELEANIVRSCDILDLGWACVEEKRLGNRTREIELVYSNVREYMTAYQNIPGVDDIVAMLATEWECVP
jgi:5'-deoxynucleotidase YfbR-like HD superfamily hydrolase